jgi:hypothetical protein
MAASQEGLSSLKLVDTLIGLYTERAQLKISAGTLPGLTEIFLGFPYSIHANAGIVR